jgi:hypothetical protein
MLHKIRFFSGNAQLTWHGIKKFYEIISLLFNAPLLLKFNPYKFADLIYRYVNIVVFSFCNFYFYSLKRQ